MRPPVALLAYVPGRATAGGVLAVRRVLAGVAGDPYALAARVPVRFFDLPAAHQLALKAVDG